MLYVSTSRRSRGPVRAHGARRVLVAWLAGFAFRTRRSSANSRRRRGRKCLSEDEMGDASFISREVYKADAYRSERRFGRRTRRDRSPVEKVYEVRATLRRPVTRGDCSDEQLKKSRRRELVRSTSRSAVPSSRNVPRRYRPPTCTRGAGGRRLYRATSASRSARARGATVGLRRRKLTAARPRACARRDLLQRHGARRRGRRVGEMKRLVRAFRIEKQQWN